MLGTKMKVSSPEQCSSVNPKVQSFILDTVSYKVFISSLLSTTHNKFPGHVDSYPLYPNPGSFNKKQGCLSLASRM